MSEHITVGHIHVQISEILVIRGEGNYSNIITRDGRKLLSCRTLKYFATMLEDIQFIRPSKSALVNRLAIAHIDFKSQKSIRLENGEMISISRRNVRPLRELYQSFQAS